jgi:glycosyltransferase involved in cell wall biosynthesis
MRIAYCDHSFHQKTISTKFLPDLLTSRGHEVDLFWDFSWEGGDPVHFSQLSSYDAVVIFQALPHGLPSCIASHHPNVTFIPMLDQFGIAKGPLFDLANYWRPFHGSKVVSFSHAVHAIATSNGVASICMHYMPTSIGGPSIAKQNHSNSGLSAFFWARRPSEVSVSMVSKLLAGVKKELIMHVHLSTDPGEQEVDKSEVEFAFRECRSLTTSRWFESKNEILEIIKNCDIYIAPRLEEGIGQSFLEALAAGLCVVAPNNGTMNEYLVDGVNGLLYNPNNPKELDFSELSQIRKNARKSSAQFTRNWLADQNRLASYITCPSSDFYATEHIYQGIRKGSKHSPLAFKLKRLLNRLNKRMSQ